MSVIRPEVEPIDVFIIGGGVYGSSAAYQFSKKVKSDKLKIPLADLYSPPHTMGSSHGDTRVTRLAIAEGDIYTHLTARSHEIWPEIEREYWRTFPKKEKLNLFKQVGYMVVQRDHNAAEVHGTDFFQAPLDAAKRWCIKGIENYDNP